MMPTAVSKKSFCIFFKSEHFSAKILSKLDIVIVLF